MGGIIPGGAGAADYAAWIAEVDRRVEKRADLSRFFVSAWREGMSPTGQSAEAIDWLPYARSWLGFANGGHVAAIEHGPAGWLLRRQRRRLARSVGP
jgi:hypothetical protein